MTKHISRLGLAALLVGAVGFGGMFAYSPQQPTPIRVEGSVSQVVRDPEAAARRRVTLVLPLDMRQEAVWPLVERLSLKRGLDPCLVMAIIQVESRFFPLATSHRGAMGLMQINPVTARHLGLAQPLDPKENLSAGIEYLAHLQEQFGELSLILAAYNAGPAKVAQAGGVPDIEETQRFVETVTQMTEEFRARFTMLASSS